eukprot:CAMPEP_0170568160 /NCGR_PEP_ID=MMETSP0211-20121228/80977_1 /TAXON_ID=311385 /ORGANISM="Pseudokeronopsis sp., Strain OXSARD2" /LENGTH=66 /DNA_ID=CAMNT_0010889889 /DNA_START=242 /DNA_END=442 /DNA_ORIENTATION=-
MNGADLMWPGVSEVSGEEFKSNELAVVFALNKKVTLDQSTTYDYSPIAIGKTISNGVPNDMKGRAI